MDSQQIGIQVTAVPEKNQKLENTVQKVRRKLLYFLLILFIFSFLDRINIGFVGKQLSADLGLTALSFGLANTIFYIFYICFGIPSNLMLKKFGTKLWIGTIIIVWGIASSCTAFATDEKSLYIIRAIVGIAEAGFMPGMLLYLTQWFPTSHRSRANAIFMLAMPFTAMFGAVITGYILNLHDWHGFSGWQWVFLLEGLPCIILGFLVYAKLPNTPKDAKWLDEEEKQVLIQALEEEKLQNKTILQQTQQNAAMPPSTWAFLNRSIVRCAIVYFCIVTTCGMVNIWVPQIVSASLPNLSSVAHGIIVAIPHLVTIIALFFLCYRSDKTQERYWHTFFPMLFGFIGWLMAAYLQAPVLQIIGLCLACMAGFSTMGIFWAFADESLSSDHKAIGIAFINACGNSATIVSSFLIGFLKDLTHSFATGMVYGSVLMLLGAIIMLTFTIKRVPQKDLVKGHI
ncbi:MULTISPECIES: MFS transporter [unclassified Acinetobacter]|uniref:MFS transporter n=1 Tax=unclassified Acinetobacter TaxID=196816 RepID=UPI00190D5AE1|nr:MULTISPECIES: MFS transporter [unclassified Acinetobacter]MBK0062447.1 MFS transporter [Acinetobacter sp. S55]MBK0066251.1 MFS transporter [Acinetobacter sp. S54]